MTAVRPGKLCDCGHQHTRRRCTCDDSYGVPCTCPSPNYYWEDEDARDDRTSV